MAAPAAEVAGPGSLKPARPKSIPPAKPDEQTLSHAYIHLLCLMLVIREEQMDGKAPGLRL